MNASFAAVLETVQHGGCVIFPTETLYALGGDGRSQAVVDRVYALKGRALTKPLPLVIGAPEQVSLVCKTVGPVAKRLAAAFWPGPLSLLLPIREGFPSQVSNDRGLTSVRLTPHPLAARLCIESQAPLVATSANKSGCPATADPTRLDPELMAEADGILAEPPWPLGGEPSTVVEILLDGQLHVHRWGALSLEKILAAGFEVERENAGEGSNF